MTISGSGSIPPSYRAISNRPAQAYGIQQRPAADAGAKAQAGAQAQAGTQVGAPHGAEGLRSVLNDEERAYFDQIASLGPITYGRNRAAGMTPDVPTGLRLDVRG